MALSDEMDRHYFDPSPLNLCVIQSSLQSDRLGCPNEEIPIGHVSCKRIDFKPRHIPTDRNKLFNCDLERCKGTGTDIFWLGPAKPCMRMEAQFNSNFLWFKSLASAYKPAINSWPVRLKFVLIVVRIYNRETKTISW